MNELNKLRFYEQENEWLNTPYNKTVMYLPGRGVTSGPDGEYQVYHLEDIQDFVFGQDIEPELLEPALVLEQEETIQLAKLQSINVFLNPHHLHGLLLRREQETEYLVFLSRERPDAYLKVQYEDYLKLDMDRLQKMLPALVGTDIEHPYEVEVAENGNS